MTQYLEGSTKITQERQNIRLEYYLIEEKRDIGENALYGMMIEKEEAGTLAKTRMIAKAISYSREYVESMLRLFMKNTVTPLTMLELVDEYVSRVTIQP